MGKANADQVLCRLDTGGTITKDSGLNEKKPTGEERKAEKGRIHHSLRNG